MWGISVRLFENLYNAADAMRCDATLFLHYVLLSNVILFILKTLLYRSVRQVTWILPRHLHITISIPSGTVFYSLIIIWPPHATMLYPSLPRTYHLILPKSLQIFEWCMFHLCPNFLYIRSHLPICFFNNILRKNFSITFLNLII